MHDFVLTLKYSYILIIIVLSYSILFKNMIYIFGLCKNLSFRILIYIMSCVVYVVLNLLTNNSYIVSDFEVLY